MFCQLPMYQRLGQLAFKKNLNNILALCKAMDQPHQQFPSIHIAGTNGKGSTAHLLSAVLQASGLKVGLYTSPHYRDFRERIKLNGNYISEKEVIDFVDCHKSLFESIQPSFFEITVAMAFNYFAKSKIDIAVIETGLGGRLDSTNIVHPVLSIITNISFDHQQMLGNTLPKIAGEKAGIIKKSIPVVIGEEQQETKMVFEKKAKKEGAPIYFANRKFTIKHLKSDRSCSYFNVEKHHKKWLSDLAVNLHGSYQQKNIVSALEAIDQINKLERFPKLDEKIIRKGFKNLRNLTNFKGRWQVIGHQPTILCDSAHNENGIQSVCEEIRKMKYNRLHIVLGMVKDKSIEKLLTLFPKDACYYFAKADIPRGLDANLLKAQATLAGLKGRTYISVANALKAAKRNAHPDDLIFIGGSTFTVAEIIQ